MKDTALNRIISILQSLFKSNSKIVGEGGCKFIDSAATTVNAYCFIVNADCVLTTLAGGATTTATSTNFLTDIGLSGKTLKQGTQIFAPEGYLFNSITPSSGSVIAYKLDLSA